MTLGYSQKFPDGTPTQFKEKVLLSQDHEPGQLVSVAQMGESLKELFPKPHSIREDVHDRWRPGMTIHHVYDNRTPQRDCFLVNTCIWVQRIMIMYSSSKVVLSARTGKTDLKTEEHEIPTVIIDGMVMNPETVAVLARNDGFESVDKFYAWFNRNFSGKIIHWSKLKY